MSRNMMSDTLWEVPNRQKPYLLAFLLLACVLLGIVNYYNLISSLLFIPSSFVIIVFAGLWYERKALWFALFLGILHIVLTNRVFRITQPEVLYLRTPNKRYGISC